jgi:hypothetical protein
MDPSFAAAVVHLAAISTQPLSLLYECLFAPLGLISGVRDGVNTYDVGVRAAFAEGVR